MRITSGSTGERELHRFRAISGVAYDLEPIVRRENRLEGLPEQAVIVRDQHADPFWHVDGGLHDVSTLNVNCYGRFVKGRRP